MKTSRDDDREAFNGTRPAALIKRGSFLLFLSLATSAAAQSPDPILRATLDPPRVVVGQPVKLQITVLAPNYMTAPPVFPDLQLRNVVTRTLDTINLTEEHDGVTYAGVRHDFAFHPQEPGSYAIADQTVTVTYAADPPKSREATMPLPRLAFEAVIPDGAETLDPFVATTRLTLREQVEPARNNLRVGDAVVRTVTIEAEGIPAMLLPALPTTAPDGIAVYQDQPALQDRSDRRTDALTALRTERVTYMLQKPGDHVVVALDLPWWNVAQNRIETAHADALVLHVAADAAATPTAPSPDAAPSRTIRWRALLATLLDHWRMVLLALAALAALVWCAPPALRAITDAFRRHRAAYLRSEAASFAHLRRTARKGDPAHTYFALLNWLARFEPVADPTLAAFRAAAQDPALDDELARLEARLFAPAETRSTDWSPRPLLRRVAAARRRLNAATKPSAGRLQSLPPALNPYDTPAAAAWRLRPVAR